MNILFVNACVRSESRTYRLAQKVLQKLGGQVTEVNLEKENIQPLTRQTLEMRNKLLAEKRYDNEFFRYARQFAGADIIVIAAPFWDFSFPALLKCYIEAVNALGITFKYTAEGVAGLCKAKKLIYIATSGGYIPDNNFGYSYLKALSEDLYGIPETQFFKAEGLDIAEADIENIIQESLAQIDSLL